MKQLATRVLAGTLVALAVAGLWAYRSFGGVLASSDSPNVGSVYYRLVVRQVPFTADPTGAGGTYEATVFFRGKERMTSNSFRWDSGGDSNVRIIWNSAADFTIYFGDTPVHGWFFPWQSAHWEYGKEK
ncbi:MAG: hypothetical protein HYZ75_02635 [Elusimicrobia bacterium]|nr:hypothetical protein [Elusimicrobiota bacterium]